MLRKLGKDLFSFNATSMASWGVAIAAVGGYQYYENSKAGAPAEMGKDEIEKINQRVKDAKKKSRDGQ